MPNITIKTESGNKRTIACLGLRDADINVDYINKRCDFDVSEIISVDKTNEEKIKDLENEIYE